MPRDKTTVARELGRKDCEAGKTKYYNPYPYESEEFYSWLDGWEEAKESYNGAHRVISDRLEALGLDPYELRDFLDGLPK